MTILGLWVFGSAIYRVWVGVLPEVPVMGAVGFFALLANLSVALTLYQSRWPDLFVTAIISALNISSGIQALKRYQLNICAKDLDETLKNINEMPVSQ